MWYGAAYYPEHWPESRWAEDARLMRAADSNARIELIGCDNNGTPVYFALNHDRTPQRVVVDGAWRDLLREADVRDSFELAGYEMVLLRRQP